MGQRAPLGGRGRCPPVMGEQQEIKRAGKQRGSPALESTGRAFVTRGPRSDDSPYQWTLVANCRKRPWTVRVTLPMEPPKKLVPSMIGPLLMML